MSCTTTGGDSTMMFAGLYSNLEFKSIEAEGKARAPEYKTVVFVLREGYVPAMAMPGAEQSW